MQRSGMQRYNIDALLQRRNNTRLQRRNDATLGSAAMHSLMPRHGAARRGNPNTDVGGESPVPVQMWAG
jgi:hypothetical protein